MRYTISRKLTLLTAVTCLCGCSLFGEDENLPIDEEEHPLLNEWGGTWEGTAEWCCDSEGQRQAGPLQLIIDWHEWQESGRSEPRGISEYRDGSRHFQPAPDQALLSVKDNKDSTRLVIYLTLSMDNRYPHLAISDVAASSWRAGATFPVEFAFRKSVSALEFNVNDEPLWGDGEWFEEDKLPPEANSADIVSRIRRTIDGNISFMQNCSAGDFHSPAERTSLGEVEVYSLSVERRRYYGLPVLPDFSGGGCLGFGC